MKYWISILVFLSAVNARAEFSIFGINFGNSPICSLKQDPKDKKVAAEIERMTTLTDQQIIDEGQALLDAGKKCEGARILAYVKDRYPIMNYTRDEAGVLHGKVVVNEPAYYWDAYMKIVRVLMESTNYYDACELLKNALMRNPQYERNDFVQFLLAETYYRRIPKDPRLDPTATLKAQANYALIMTSYKDTPYKSIILARLKFINLWLSAHELQGGIDYYLGGKYYAALVHLKNMYEKYKRYQNTATSDYMAQNFYYSCRAWKSLEHKGKLPDESLRASAVDGSENALEALRQFFPDSEWRKKGEERCGKKGQDDFWGPDNFEYKNPADVIPPADVVAFDLFEPLK